MRRKKIKYEKAQKLSNIIQPEKNRGKEKLQYIIARTSQIFVELAAGASEYTLYLAEKNPDTLCIAFDYRSDRLLSGAEKAIEKNLSNAFFVKERAENLKEIFEHKKADKLWLAFPDPYPKKRHQKRRLTSPEFLDLYKEILKPEAKVFFKTDDPDFFAYTLGTIKEKNLKIIKTYEDLLRQTKDPELILETKYQSKAIQKSRKIYAIIFCLQMGK